VWETDSRRSGEVCGGSVGKCESLRLPVFTITPSKRLAHFERGTGSALRSYLHPQQCECRSSESGSVLPAPQTAAFHCQR
jgi:hypothetical protein